MRLLCYRVIVLATFFSIGAPGRASADPGRKTVWSWFSSLGREKGDFNAATSDTDTGDHSPFTIGTMMGVTYAFKTPTQYRLAPIASTPDMRVAVDSEGARFLPGSYLLGSVKVQGDPGKSLSIIVPAGAVAGNGGVNVAAGFGASYGLRVAKSSEIGLTLVLIWTQQQHLAPDQQDSLDHGTVIASDRTDFKTRSEMSLGFGVYLAPLF